MAKTEILRAPLNRLGAARRSTARGESRASPVLRAPQGEKGKPRRTTPQLPKSQNIDMSHAMEELFGDPAYTGFVLQDRKRLPSRFSARVSGALTSRLS
ncbi:hypothetical protein NKH55_19305 [Mesorhizobium opportunistum]|uniref:hypothetical protein n=1 Tax=Mesorhizobium opportunistum TaxID=593909 RepID=UPI003338A835